MCNLYRLSSSRTEVANFFDLEETAAAGNAPNEIYPGYPGLVVARGEVRQMVWGFPLPQRGASGQPLKPKPVNNARADKLASPFWKPSFLARRCLVPLTAFAEAEGARGAKTRTWLSLPGSDLFAIAGLWRETDEWGPAYTMIITEASVQVAAVHNRMPVIVERQDWQRWLYGSPDDAQRLCTPFAGAMHIERTQQPWVARH
jgi:putative SOS response-associated peptidase YedK